MDQGWTYIFLHRQTASRLGDGRMKTIVTMAAALASAGLTLGATGQEAIWPMPDAPPVVMNTVSALQFYGPTPGFHHGLDLAAPAGTHVVAPVSGRVEIGYYYERRSDYTYEVAIITADGTRWELPRRQQALARGPTRSRWVARG
jgi:murein DD-endopeptidase MepM/ murein hydrolase activator NlpD